MKRAFFSLLALLCTCLIQNAVAATTSFATSDTGQDSLPVSYQCTLGIDGNGTCVPIPVVIEATSSGSEPPKSGSWTLLNMGTDPNCFSNACAFITGKQIDQGVRSEWASEETAPAKTLSITMATNSRNFTPGLDTLGCTEIASPALAINARKLMKRIS